MKRLGNLILGILCFLGTTTFGDITVRSYTDRTQLAANENLTLILEISSDRDLPSLSVPPLNDFDIVGNSRSSRISIVNGQVSKQLEQRYSLIPKRTGKLTIPALSYQMSGKRYNTDAIFITVEGAGSSPKGKDVPTQGTPPPSNLFLEAEVPKAQFYAGEPIPYTFRFYNRLALFGQPSLQEPIIKNLTKMPQDPVRKNYQKVLNGMTYGVEEMTLVYLPVTSGEASFGPVSTIFSLSPFEANREARSNELKVTIIPVPAHSGFNQAVGTFTFHSEADRSSVFANEGFYLKFIFSGYGNLKLATAPDLVLPKDCDLYDPRVSLSEKWTENGLKSEKTFEYLVIPRVSGVLTIPSVKWTFFDPGSHTFIIREAPARRITVQKGSGKILAKAVVESEQQDIRYIKHSLGSVYTLYGQRWKLLILILNIMLWTGLIVYRPIRWILSAWFIHHPDRLFARQLKSASRSPETFYSTVYDALNQASRNRNLSESVIDELRYFEAKKYAPQETVYEKMPGNEEAGRAQRLYKEIRRCLQK